MVFNELELPLIKTSKASTSTDKSGAELEMEFNQEDDHRSEEELDYEQTRSQEKDSDESECYQLVRDRELTVSKPTQRYGYVDTINYALSTTLEKNELEADSYQEAMNRKDKHKWLQAMQEEMNSLKKNGTWILVKQPKQQKLVGCKWIFKRKQCISGV